MATAVAVTLGVAFQTLGQTKIYQAQATVQFDPNPPKPLGAKIENVVDLGGGNPWDNHEYYETQYRVIQSMRLALAVVADLGLDHDAAFLADLPPGAKTAPTSVLPEVAAAEILARLKVEPVKSSRLAVVKFEDADPARAQRVLAAVVDDYVAENLDDALSSTTAAVDWLHSQQDKLKVDLEDSEMALHDYKKEKNILSVAFDDQSNMLREQLAQLTSTITTVRTRKEEVAARRAELASLPTDNPSALPASELLQSGLLQQIRMRYEEGQRELDGLLAAGKGDNHPEVQAARARVEASKKALLAEVRNIQGAVDQDLSGISRQEAGLSGLIDRVRHDAFGLNVMEIEYNRLRRTKENTEKLYSLVLERSKETDLTRMLRVNNIRVLDRPLLPRMWVRPRVAVNIALGAVAGVALGIAMAMARALLDRTVKTPEDIESEFGVPFLGLLPEMGGSKRSGYYGRRRRQPQAGPGAPYELVVHEDPSSAIAEAARSIRTNLLFMAPDHPYRTLLVTSAAPAEGKTTVACCVAIAMAQTGQRVLLVDCDLRRPRLHRIFGVGSEQGLTTALLDPNEEPVPFVTGIDNLSVLPAGPIPPNPAEPLP